MKETEKNKQEGKSIFWFPSKFHYNVMGFRCPYDIYIIYMNDKTPLIYILLGDFIWKKNIKYYWAVIRKTYKQVIKCSFLQAGMVVIN